MLPARVTIHDVARAAGVSVATVSKVANGRYGVAQNTIAKVSAVIDELGYETSLVARSLRSHRTNVIGILVAGFEPFSTELLKGISAAAVGSGYELLAYAGALTDEARVGWERRSLSRLAGTLVDAAIIVTPTVQVAGAPVPIVAIDPHTGLGDVPAVDTDNAEGARIATRYLISLGHRRIAHVRGRGDLQSALLREQGYRESLAEAGIAFDPDLVREGAYWGKPTTRAAQELLSLPDRPTAIFAANDLSAVRVLDVAREMGIRVPEELSIVGFDNVPESATSTPQLTTVAQPLHDMGAQALQMVVQMLRRGELEQQYVHLPAHLVVRQSTAPAPSPAAIADAQSRAASQAV
ncbi:LacI family DNA-binding transcriptional regulator [Microbacterium kribbense]|uniref:LacI family DNA-binding transcriptional regulator n=2 Tax=Microbacterium kribbense TaxID=433645 RepID=A0ABP7GZJ5_9MICO